MAQKASIPYTFLPGLAGVPAYLATHMAYTLNFPVRAVTISQRGVYRFEPIIIDKANGFPEKQHKCWLVFQAS